MTQTPNSQRPFNSQSRGNSELIPLTKLIQEVVGARPGSESALAIDKLFQFMSLHQIDDAFVWQTSGSQALHDITCDPQTAAMHCTSSEGLHYYAGWGELEVFDNSKEVTELWAWRIDSLQNIGSLNLADDLQEWLDVKHPLTVPNPPSVD